MMGNLFKYSLLFLLILPACVDIIIEKDDPADEDIDEMVRILDGQFALMKAARRGDLDEVKRLLEIELFKNNVNDQDEDGNTASYLLQNRDMRV